MTITKFTTTYHVSVTLPSDDYADAGAAVLYAKAHGLWVRLETETEFDCTAEEAAALWDALAPGERFRVLMLMTVKEAEQAEADRDPQGRLRLFQRLRRGMVGHGHPGGCHQGRGPGADHRQRW
mgnify:CR=1 FL=1